MAPPALDVITIGRSSVDLYGQQVGGRLEDMATFSKAVGGCPSNIAIGTARLGLKSGLITRVGDEAMGRFIREQMAREGVATEGIRTDPERLTALVILGVRDDDTFPLIFCARTAPTWPSTRATSTRRSSPRPAPSSSPARISRAEHRRRADEGDPHRPGARPAGGLRRRLPAEPVGPCSATAPAKSAMSPRTPSPSICTPILPLCDLIVGTEEELHIAGGVEDTLEAICAGSARARRRRSCCKRGPMGCVVFPGAIPASLEEGVKGRGFPVEVYNVLGAGDAFLSGFLRGWLRGEPLETACAYANACGAFAVSRLLCSPESPTFAELQYFLRHGSPHRALRHDAALNHIHWATTRRPGAGHADGPRDRSPRAVRGHGRRGGRAAGAHRRVQGLAVAAAARVAGGRPGFGMLIDGTYGREALFRAADHPFWIGRPVEEPGSRPLDFEGGGDLGSKLIEWPLAHTIKCLCFYHPDDPPELKARQERELLRLTTPPARLGRELLVEIICGKHGPVGPTTVASVLERLYALGIKPDWWKLEPQADAAAWRATPRRSDGTTPIAAASCSSASKRRRTNLKSPSRSPPGSPRQGLCRRPHDLQRGRPALAAGRDRRRGGGRRHGERGSSASSTPGAARARPRQGRLRGSAMPPWQRSD